MESRDREQVHRSRSAEDPLDLRIDGCSLAPDQHRDDRSHFRRQRAPHTPSQRGPHARPPPGRRRGITLADAPDLLRVDPSTIQAPSGPPISIRESRKARFVERNQESSRHEGDPRRSRRPPSRSGRRRAASVPPWRPPDSAPPIQDRSPGLCPEGSSRAIQGGSDRGECEAIPTRPPAPRRNRAREDRRFAPGAARPTSPASPTRRIPPRRSRRRVRPRPFRRSRGTRE